MVSISEAIIKKFGGPQVVAKICGVDVSRVYRWTYPKGRRHGTGGLIPLNHQHTLLSAAVERGVDLSPDDFFNLPISKS